MAQTSDQVLTQVNTIMCGLFKNDSIRLKYETTARDVKEWDSLNHIELILAVEKHFKIKFNFMELQKFKNVGEMCDNIVNKLSGTSA
jgi:acyl carrier protein